MTSWLVVQCSNKYATEACENAWHFLIYMKKNLKISFLNFKNKVLDFKKNFRMAFKNI